MEIIQILYALLKSCYRFSLMTKWSTIAISLYGMGGSSPGSGLQLPGASVLARTAVRRQQCTANQGDHQEISVLSFAHCSFGFRLSFTVLLSCFHDESSVLLPTFYQKYVLLRGPGKEGNLHGLNSIRHLWSVGPENLCKKPAGRSRGHYSIS
jgi:hypothetical protein